MVEKVITAERARELLLKLPDKFNKFKKYAEEQSKNTDDEYVLCVFNLIKYSKKTERIVPYCWEIEYDIDLIKNYY